jgi:hypothetical protein
MIPSERVSQNLGRALAIGVASIVFAVSICLPGTGQSAEIDAAMPVGIHSRAQHADHDQQAQSGGLRDPERDRERPEKRRQARLTLSPPSATLAPGGELQMRLIVVGARELLRLPATLRYDPSLLRVVSVSPGSAWRGGVPPTLMYDSSRPGELVVGLARLGRDADPLVTDGEVLRVTFEAVAPGDSDIRLERYALLGKGGRSQEVEAKQAKVSIQ